MRRRWRNLTHQRDSTFNGDDSSFQAGAASNWHQWHSGIVTQLADCRHLFLNFAPIYLFILSTCSLVSGQTTACGGGPVCGPASCPCWAQTVAPVATRSTPRICRRSARKLGANSVGFDANPRRKKGATLGKSMLLEPGLFVYTADTEAAAAVRLVVR